MPTASVFQAWRSAVCRRFLLPLSLLVAAHSAWAIHFDVELRTTNGPVAGSRITTEFYGDLNLAGLLPIDHATGYKIFPGYFGDLEGGPYLTDDPGFQAFAGTFLRREEVHFRALGTLQYWNPVSGRWGPAADQVRVALFGGIPAEVIIGYTENPPAWQALYDYYAAGTRFSAVGIDGPPTALIADAKANGAFHAHLDWKISAGSDEPPVGAYMMTIELWSPAQANGQPKYLPAQPIQVVFERGISEDQMRSAILARVQPPPPPDCAGGALNWLVAGTACSAAAPQAASGSSVTLLDEVAPAIGAATFQCVAGTWGSATSASCAIPPPRVCTARVQTWLVDGQQCSGTTPDTASGSSATATDDTPPALGSAVFACNDGDWSAPTAAQCAIPPPAACGAAALSWTVGSNTCRGTVAASSSGSSLLVRDDEAPLTGSARFTCSNGSWSEPTEASCNEPPPPRPCSGQTLSWLVGGEQCSAAVPAAASGTHVTALDDVGPAIGSAVFQCTDGSWGGANAASCAVPPPAPCNAAALNWTVGANTCRGTVAASASGSSLTVRDDEGPLTGSARFSCSNGNWGDPVDASCNAPPPPRACSGQTLSWLVGSEQCSGSVPGAASDAQVTALDDTGPAVGSAIFQCTDGNWGGATAASCAVPPPAPCAATPTSWAVAGTVCTGALPARASGASVLVRDDEQPNTGWASFSCSNGQWSAPSQAICTPPPPPRACSAESRNWLVNGNACTATVPAAASGASSVATDDGPPTLGSASFQCTDGSWGPATSATCNLRTPAACQAQTAGWTVAGNACEAPLAGAASGSSVLAEDTTQPNTGSARFTCDDGRWSAPSQAVCTLPPPPRACSARTMNWRVGTLLCSGPAAETASGLSTVVSDTEEPATGSAAFACSDGQWSAPTSPTCTVPPPRACAASTLNWLEGTDQCNGIVAETASGTGVTVSDTTEPTIGTARFACTDGSWGTATQARCSRPAPRSCSGQDLSWLGSDGHQCSAGAPSVASDVSVTLNDILDPLVGSAVFRCTNGNWGAALSASCAPRPPRACVAATLNWLEGSDACNAVVGETASGTEVAVSDSTEPTIGTARFTCGDGQWSAALQPRCSRPAPPPCTAQDLSWLGSGGHQCIATAPSVASDISVTLNDSVDPLVGSAVFRCSNGNWSAALGASCAPRPPRACSTQALAWTVNGHACQAQSVGAASGAEAFLQDLQSPTLGSARFVCNDGQWQAQAGAQCGAMTSPSRRGQVRPPWARPAAPPWQGP